MTQSLRVIHVLISGEAAKNRLPQHADEGMPAILASACV